MAEKTLGSLLKEHRLKRNLIMEDVAGVLGITRQRYGQIESGKRTIYVEPERAIKLCRLLEIDMLDFCLTMGYPIKCPGFDNPREALVWKAFREAAPSVQQLIRRQLTAGSASFPIPEMIYPSPGSKAGESQQQGEYR